MTSEPHDTASDAKRVTKHALIRAVARRSGLPIKTVTAVYDSLIVEIIAQVRNGVQVTLNGFGGFTPQVHKGHHAQFGAKGQGRLPDYPVLKFSGADGVRDFLALDDETAAQTRVPGTTRRLTD